MILRKPLCQRLSVSTYLGVAFLGLLLLPVAPQSTGAQSSGQPAAAASDQKLRDLEQRIQKLEERMDQALRALHDRGHGTDTLLTTARASRPLDQSVRSLRLDTNVGNIRVTRSDSAELTVEAIVRVDRTRVDPEKTSKDFDQHVRIAQTGDVLTIADAHKGAPDHGAWAVALKVAIPRALSVAGRTGVGNMDVELASGAVSLSTGVGNLTLKADRVASVTANTGTGNTTLRVSKVTDKIEAKVGTGNVVLEFIDAGSRADVALTTSVGDLVLELPPGPVGKFDLKSGLGSIAVEGLRGVQVKKNGLGASASTQLGERGPGYQLHTGVGSITTTVRK
jgi:hypothetical protein